MGKLMPDGNSAALKTWENEQAKGLVAQQEKDCQRESDLEQRKISIVSDLGNFAEAFQRDRASIESFLDLIRRKFSDVSPANIKVQDIYTLCALVDAVIEDEATHWMEKEHGTAI